METLGQRIISCRPLSRFIQIDRLVTVATGAGTQTTAAFYLPHARYTVFPVADPERAARSFALLDQRGDGVRDDWSSFPPDVHGLSVPLVQDELQAGYYRLTIETAGPGCAWQGQVVLNYAVVGRATESLAAIATSTAASHHQARRDSGFSARANRPLCL